MPRVALDLNKEEDRRHVKAEWRVASGLVPGAPNEGLTAQLLASPARLADHDDSGWEVCRNIRESRSVGFTFAWYRIAVEVPATIGGVALAGSRVWFETNIDNYGEIWIDGKIDRSTGVIVGLNAPASRGGERERGGRRQARHRVPGRERHAGRAARRHLHALRDARVRVTGITLARFVRRLARWGAAIALIILGLVLSIPGIPGPGLLVVLLGVFVLLPESRWLRQKYVALARRYPKLFPLV